jgi:hypothetical protein
MNHSHKRKRVADAESAETKQPNNISVSAIAAALSAQPKCSPHASLEYLSSIQEIWDKICWCSSGNSVKNLSLSTLALRNATVQTPAFVFLTGRDADGFLVPWEDPENILAAAKIFNGWNPSKHFRVRSCYQPYAYDREIHALSAAENFFDRPNFSHRKVTFRGPAGYEHPLAIEMGYSAEVDYSYGAPARPSSACSDGQMGDVYVYRLHNPCERVLSPVLFPDQAHRLEAARFARRLCASPYDSTTSCEESNSSWCSDVAE